jgi:hypothetical protein
MASTLPPLPWESTMASLSSSVGLPVDQLKFTLCMLLALPVGYVFKAVTRDPYTCSSEQKPSAIAARHAVCMTIGVSFMIFLFGYDAIHSILSSAVGFLIMRLIPTKNVHIWMTVWAMSYLTCSHTYRMFVAYLGWELDFTNPQLLVTQKLMNIAFALYDSSRDPSKCTEEQIKRKLLRPPTFLEFFGYIFSLHTLLGGPATDYNDYICWIDGTNCKGEKPSPTVAVLKKVGGGVICVVLFVVIGGHFPVGVVCKPEWLEQHSPLYVFLYANFALFLMRHRYYFAWVLSDAACNAAGLGYAGKNADGTPNWSGVLNIQYPAVEGASNFRSAMTGWNIATSNWLRRCIYERVPPTGPRTAATFAMSAFWHGLYPGYFMCFLSCALINETARVLRRHLRPLFIPNEKAERSPLAQFYHLGSWFITIASLNYCAVPFMVLSFERAIVYWVYWRFLPHFISAALFLLVPIVLKAPKREPAKKE